MNSVAHLIDHVPPRVSRTRYVCQTLKHLIATGKLKAGDRLPTEAELCVQFNVSRTTLREAIQALRAGGYLQVAPGRGSYVTMPEARQIQDDLAFYFQAMQTSASFLQNMKTQIVQLALSTLEHSSVAARRGLFDDVVSRHDSLQEAQKKENQWLGKIVALSGNQILELFLGAILTAENAMNIQRITDADATLRTIQTQIRLNTALVDGEFDLARRLLLTYLTASAPQAHHFSA